MNTTKTVDRLNEYIIANFDKAISEGWIETYFQPIVRASNCKVCEEEALARWDDPGFGVLNPDTFIPILEVSGLIERLDLYVLGEVLEKMRQQAKIGLPIVTTSVNFSQVDFQSGDLVEKIDDIVSASGISKDKIAIEISDSSVITDRSRTIAQLELLQKLGYKIWLDNYGCGDLSFILSPRVDFDVVKLDMSMTRQSMTSGKARIVITELIKTSVGLGIEAIVKGVENKQQLDFLKEIGCGKLQGFYFCKPLPISSIFDRYQNGLQIGFENPKEADYYAAVDKVSLHDISFMKMNPGLMGDFFDTLPMAILEIDEEELRVMRINKVFERFLADDFPEQKDIQRISLKASENKVGSYTLSSIKRSLTTDKQIIIDDRTPTGKTVHMMIQKIAQNPVTKKYAVLFAIISISDAGKAIDSLSYNYIARALSEDYVAMYFVDMDSNNYVVYHSDGINRDISISDHGDDYFYDAHNNVDKRIYKEDEEMFNELVTKENIMKSIEENGSFSVTFRADDEIGIHYVNMKAVRARADKRHIIIGISDVDNQMKQQELFKLIQEERIIYSRMAALEGDFLAVYSVDLSDDSYVVYKTPQGVNFIGTKEKGNDFFGETLDRIKEVIHKDDYEGFVKNVTKKHIFDAINRSGSFSYKYRFLNNKVITYVNLKAVTVEENGEQKLIVGLINIDAQVKKEAEYAENLSAAEDMALKDALTGVKNKHAYAIAEKELNDKVLEGTVSDYAIVVFDLNGLKFVNDTFGHQKGDDFIKRGCKMICDTFAHSPVFRIGGDEFAVIAQGKDYDNLDSIMNSFDASNYTNKIRGEVTIAAGAARSTSKMFVKEVFEKADANMYEKKNNMKKTLLI